MKNNIKIPLSLVSLVILLILSFPSYKLIPFGTPDGLDFNNVYAYSTCDKILSAKYENNFYMASGTDCGDAMGRPFVYPPLLYYSTKWVSFFDTFESARLAWRIFICTSFLICILLWSRSKKDFLYTLPLFLGLMLQFPAIFALERGNNDILVIILWTLSAFSYKKKAYSWSGCFASLSILMKVYPLFSFLVVTIGLALNKKITILKKFIIGSFLTGLITFFLFHNLWYSFYAEISGFSNSRMVLDIINHSVQYLTPNKGINTLIYLLIIAIWSKAFRFDSEEKLMSFSGALALSTYFSATSFDYNLITTYPLIVLLFAQYLKTYNPRTYLLLFVLLLSTVGNRSWFIFGGDLGYKIHILLQVFSLIFAAIHLIPTFYLKNYLKYCYINLKVKTL